MPSSRVAHALRMPSGRLCPSARTGSPASGDCRARARASAGEGLRYRDRRQMRGMHQGIYKSRRHGWVCASGASAHMLGAWQVHLPSHKQRHGPLPHDQDEVRPRRHLLPHVAALLEGHAVEAVQVALQRQRRFWGNLCAALQDTLGSVLGQTVLDGSGWGHRGPGLHGS